MSNMEQNMKEIILKAIKKARKNDETSISRTG